MKGIRARGFTLVEFAAVIVVTAALSAILLHRFDFYKRQAEDAAARQLVAALRTALQVEVARTLSAGRSEALAALAERNPMDLLREKPANYLGIYYAPDPARIRREGWVFDPRDKTLVYLPSNAETFSPSTSNLPRFKVELIRSPSPVDAAGKGKPMMSLALNEVSAQSAR